MTKQPEPRQKHETDEDLLQIKRESKHDYCSFCFLNWGIVSNYSEVFVFLVGRLSFSSMRRSSEATVRKLLQPRRLCSLWVAPDQIDYSWHTQFIWLHCPPTLFLLVSEMCVCVCVCVCVFSLEAVIVQYVMDTCIDLWSHRHLSVLCLLYSKYTVLCVWVRFIVQQRTDVLACVVLLYVRVVPCVCACVWRVLVCDDVWALWMCVRLCVNVFICTLSLVFVHMQGGNVMEDQDLRDVGITDPGHRKKILHAARNLPKVRELGTGGRNVNNIANKYKKRIFHNRALTQWSLDFCFLGD